MGGMAKHTDFFGATEIAGHINSDQSQIAQLEMHLSELVPGLEQAKESEQR